MALHVKLSPEADVELRRQRRISCIVSITVGVLMIVTLSNIFYMLGVTLLTKESQSFVATYTEEPIIKQEVKEERIKPQRKVKRTPSAVSSTTTPVVAVNSVNNAFEIPEVEIQEVSMVSNFGVNEGFGEGFGSGGFGAKLEPTPEADEGEFSFVGEKYSGKRVVFVIDYSRSMRGVKIEMVKKELTKTIMGLPDGMKYQLLYFAGPVWTAGAQFSDVEKQGGFQDIKIDGKVYKWSSSSADQGPEPKLEIEWIKSKKSTREKTIKDIQETPLIYGTKWLYPLVRACEIYPKPHTIVFLTDGIAYGDWEIAQTVSTMAKTKGITINTISLLVPKARKSLEFLAKETGGKFSLIDKEGIDP